MIARKTTSATPRTPRSETRENVSGRALDTLLPTSTWMEMGPSYLARLKPSTRNLRVAMPGSISRHGFSYFPLILAAAHSEAVPVLTGPRPTTVSKLFEAGFPRFLPEISKSKSERSVGYTVIGLVASSVTGA